MAGLFTRIITFSMSKTHVSYGLICVCIYANGRMPSAILQSKIVADINAFITIGSRISSTAIAYALHPQLVSTHENFANQ